MPQLERDTGGMEVHHQGNALPSLLTAWQCGLVAGAQAEADIAAYYYSAECPLSPDEVSMFLNIAHLMLHPETFVSTRVPLVRGVELLEKVAAQVRKLVEGLGWHRLTPHGTSTPTRCFSD